MKARSFLTLLPILFCAALPAHGESLSATQRIADIQRFSAREGAQLWPGFDKAPFSFLLIEPDRERIFCRDPLPAGFTPVATDGALVCAAGQRQRSSFPAGMLAAMPLFGPPSTIVMGTPEGTGRNAADWTRTILHEHFHQWQDALPDIYPRLAALDLADGDETGMWMINFPFPYTDPSVALAHGRASRALAAAVRARGSAQFDKALTTYLAARRSFAAAAGQRNWRYAEMQLWKEGVARWTETVLGAKHPDPAVRASAAALEASGLAALDTPDLAKSGREFAYPFGAAEAMLLEECDPAWRQHYPSQLALGPMLEAASTRCGKPD